MKELLEQMKEYIEACEEIISMELAGGLRVEIGKLFSSYQEKINKTLCDDLAVSINLPVKIDIEDGSIRIKTGINFVESRVKDESVISINPNQKQLFGE